MDISDPLSRNKRKGGHTVEMVLLPLVFKELLSRLPEEVRGYSYLRVTAEKDTTAASRIVQRWRHPIQPYQCAQARGAWEISVSHSRYLRR